MFLSKCSNCGYELTKDSQLMLYGGEKVASKIAIELAHCKNLGEKKRKLANILNSYGVKCPNCRKTDIWVWL